uniref:hypothetical protein n=1 Tax=uncultured Rhizobium sp. TaxID=155567 RepID=UPI002631D669|nr:hypothetical protein [uncultured Rhizobium sp.]
MPIPYQTVTQAEFLAEASADGVWTRAQDVPPGLREVMLSREIVDRQYDYYSPLKLGKEGLFAGMRRHQPRTARLMMEGGPLILRARRMASPPKNWHVDFGLEVHGQMVMIERNFHGSHPSDENYVKHKYYKDIEWALPEPIVDAYYSTFCGMKLLDNSWGSVFGRFLPRNVNNWGLWNQYLGFFRGYKKKYIPWLLEKLPETTPERPSKHGFFDFRCFLESVPDEQGIVEFLWVKSFCDDGTIYHIRGKDVENMRILADPVEAIDLYCEHVLSRKEGSFSFLPFTEAMS